MLEINGLPIIITSDLQDDDEETKFDSIEKASAYLTAFFLKHKGPNDSVLVRGSTAGSPGQFVGRIDGNAVVMKMSVVNRG